MKISAYFPVKKLVMHFKRQVKQGLLKTFKEKHLKIKQIASAKKIT